MAERVEGRLETAGARTHRRLIGRCLPVLEQNVQRRRTKAQPAPSAAGSVSRSCWLMAWAAGSTSGSPVRTASGCDTCSELVRGLAEHMTRAQHRHHDIGATRPLLPLDRRPPASTADPAGRPRCWVRWRPWTVGTTGGVLAPVDPFVSYLSLCHRTCKTPPANGCANPLPAGRVCLGTAKLRIDTSAHGRFFDTSPRSVAVGDRPGHHHPGGGRRRLVGRAAS